ncbi:MAG: glycosyltransferase [Pseudonocardia sp.]
MTRTGRSIICVGFAEWDAELWTNQQHLMSRLARGNRVLFVESLGLRRPQLAGRDLRRIGRRLVRGLAGPRERDGVLVVSPLVLPFHASRVVRAVNQRLLRFLVGRAARRTGLDRCPVLWAYVPQAEALLPTLRPRTVVYHCVDDIAEQKGVDGDSFRAAEARFVDRADLVIASAPALAARLEQRAATVLYAPNVADTALFATALDPGPADPAVAALPGPRIVFTGAIVATKLDVALIAGVARSRPDWSIVLVGPVGTGDPSTDVSALAGLPNVHLVGPRRYAELPAVLRAADAGIIPYALNELTSSVFPMKVYEYLAAGLPVVATPLPSLSGIDQIDLAPDAGGFVVALEKALETDDPDTRRARSERARGHSWDARVTEIAEALHAVEALTPTGTIVATPYTPSLRSGGGRRTYGIVSALAAAGPVELVYQRTGDGRPDPAFTRHPGVRLHPVTGSRGVRRLGTYLAARATGVPAGFARGVWPELADRVRALDDGRCRVVADGPIAAVALGAVARRRPVVYNAHNLESGFRHLLADPEMGSERGLRRFERRLLHHAAEAWMVSAADVAAAAELTPGAVLRRVPNVVDVAAVESRGRERTALFVGDFTYEPNRRALRFLLESIAPALAARDRDVRLVVAGRGCDTVPTRPPNVELRGFVADLDALYASAGCAVVPLRDGGGSPLKFVEALAHGLSVVATRKAAAGLEALVAGEHFLLAEETAAALADGILAALDPVTAGRLGRAGRAVAQREYSVEALVRILA